MGIEIRSSILRLENLTSTYIWIKFQIFFSIVETCYPDGTFHNSKLDSIDQRIMGLKRYTPCT